MIILSVDTALGQESSAILKDGKILAFSKATENSLQAEKLFEHINNVLSETKLKFDDIDYFAADLGPGSFTGIRIGLSAVSGICFAQNKKLIGIASLEALAYKSGLSKVHSVLNAGKGEVYSQEFKIDNDVIKTLSECKLIALDSLKTADIGNIPACKIQAIPDAKDISMSAYKMIKNNIADFSRKAPIYIRKPDAKIKINS